MQTQQRKRTCAPWIVIDGALLISLYLTMVLLFLEASVTYKIQQERPSRPYYNVSINNGKRIEKARFCQNHFETAKHSWFGKIAINRTCQNYWYFPNNNSIIWNKDVWCMLTRVDIHHSPRVQLVWHKVVKISQGKCVTLEFNFTAEGLPKEVLQRVLSLKQGHRDLYQLKSDGVLIPVLFWTCVVLFSAVFSHLLIRTIASARPIRERHATVKSTQPPASVHVTNDVGTDAV